MNKSSFKLLYFFIIFSSKIGGGFFFFLVTWFVARNLDNPHTTTYNLIASILPTILLSKKIGKLCDKYSSVSICLFSDLFRVFFLIIIIILVLNERMNSINIFFICILFYTMSESQQIGWRVTISRYFYGDDLLSMNTISVIGGQSGVIIGAACAGIIYRYNNLYVINITLLLYFLSASLTFLILHFSTDMKKKHKNNSMNDVASDRLKSIFIVERRSIFLYSIMLINILILYTLNSTLSSFVKFHLGLGAVSFSIIDASYSLGAVFGGWLVSILFKRACGVSVIDVSFIVMFFSLLMYSFSVGTIMPSLCYFLIGAAAQNSIILLTLAQNSNNKNKQGEVYAIFNSATGWIGLVVYIFSYFVIQYNMYNIFFIGLSLLVVFFWMVTRRFLNKEIYRFDDKAALKD